MVVSLSGGEALLRKPAEQTLDEVEELISIVSRQSIGKRL
jgi:hypothetical protein